MAHYAFLDSNNIVTEVITGKDEDELLEGLTPEEWYGNFRGQRCVRTSYNGNIRKNFAGIGYIYDEQRDAFIAPKVHVSWVFNEEICQWEPPVAYPTDDKFYIWNENQRNWEEVINYDN
jgi:hypothetical protein